ncbi:MAG TPA: TPM domain-containing protein [Casimicrobiaceae bacterium]|jgi:uncharacterized membrane protein
MPRSRARRILDHVVTDHHSVRRVFDEAAMKAIEGSIAAGERAHRGQVCVAIEAALPPTRVLHHLSPRDRAMEVFGLLRVWDTEENCGVLLYLLLADRDVEIVADRGIHRKVGDAQWQAICSALEADFRAGRYAEGVVRAVERMSAVLAQHFPREAASVNELPDRPTVL